jgi:hypothetical protein
MHPVLVTGKSEGRYKITFQMGTPIFTDLSLHAGDNTVADKM